MVNDLSEIPTAELVSELATRGGVTMHMIERGQQFSFDINHETIDYTNHMPKTILLEVVVRE